MQRQRSSSFFTQSQTLILICLLQLSTLKLSIAANTKPSFLVHQRHSSFPAKSRLHKNHLAITVKHQIDNKLNFPIKFDICGRSSSHEQRLTNPHMASSSETNSEKETMMRFGKFQISPSSIFYRTSLSYAIVNLRPIVPGHVLIIPNRIVARLSQLTSDEYTDLWSAVRTVQNILEEYYKPGGFNVAVQDGVVAGQSVPHVHVHILPRAEGDFERNDDVYDKLESWTPRADDVKVKRELKVLDDEDRKDRTEKEMSEEAALYRNLIVKDGNDVRT